MKQQRLLRFDNRYSHLLKNGMIFSLAPIMGITNSSYRNAFHKYFGGMSKYYAPFVSAVNTNVENPNLLKDLQPAKNRTLINSCIEMIPQILSCDGVLMRRLIIQMSALGYNEVNWNIGCPFPTVTRKKRGSGILPYPDLIDKVLNEAMKDIPCKLSIKMRLGLNDENEFCNVLKVISQYPVSELIIHPRTGKQAYSGKPNLELFAEAAALYGKHVAYNGDIFDDENFFHIKKMFPDVTHFMLGRGALSDPFLVHRLCGNEDFPDDTKIRILHDFHDEIFNSFDVSLGSVNKDIDNKPAGLCHKMKGFWEYAAVHLKNSEVFIKKIHRTKNVRQYLETVERYFQNDAGWQNKGIYYFLRESLNEN